MARISYEEGQRIAERAAWAEKGSKSVFWHTYGKRLIGPGLALAVIGGVAYAIYRMALAIGSMFSGTDTLPGSVAHSGLPVLLIALGALLLVGTIVSARKAASSPRLGPAAAVIGTLLILWVGWIAWIVGTLA